MFDAQAENNRPPAIMTIAGTDASGGAGIQADLKTFTAFGCYGTSVVTALTAQNTKGVQAIHPSPPKFVEQQILSVLLDIDVQAIKTGMLYDADNTHAVANTLRSFYKDSDMPPVVCDPVCVSTSGCKLLQADAIEIMIKDLFPLATLITPNRLEAEQLLSHRKLPNKINNMEDMISAAKNLLTLGPRAVLLKGGHVVVTIADVQRISANNPNIQVVKDGVLEDNMEILMVSDRDPSTIELVVDVLSQPDAETTLFIRPRINSTSTHGTGCTLSAALACELGRGESLSKATQSAAAYTHLGIQTAFSIGKGDNGPLNHLHSIKHRIVPPRTRGDPYPLIRLLIQKTFKPWKAYVEHEFVRLLGEGILRRECFVHFLKQDYHYLKYYSRAYALLAAKSPSYAIIQEMAGNILGIARESKMHKKFCAEWGVSEEELENCAESPATMAYGAYLIDAGLQGDTMKLLMALSACLLGYGEVGLWLVKEAKQPDSRIVLDGNPYLKWIQTYSGERYQQAVKQGLEIIESRAAADPPSAARFAEWKEAWDQCTLLEKGFWDMAMDLL